MSNCEICDDKGYFWFSPYTDNLRQNSFQYYCTCGQGKLLRTLKYPVKRVREIVPEAYTQMPIKMLMSEWKEYCLMWEENSKKEES